MDIWALLQPSSLLVLFLVLTALMLLFGRRRTAALACLPALVLAVAPLFLDLSGRLAWELERRVPLPRELPEGVDGILVLGGAVEWRVSRDLGQMNLNAAGERVLAAAALARRFPEARLVFTGTFREDVANDFVARPAALSLVFGDEYGGRTPTFIGAARSTYEDALLALERVNPRAGETWLLVTSALHMPRALATFRTLGWSLTPYPVDFLTSGEPELLSVDLRPGARLAELDAVVREWGAVLVYRRSGRIEDSGIRAGQARAG